MINTDRNASMQSVTNPDIDRWGQAILRTKTTLIKPYSKVNIHLLRAERALSRLAVFHSTRKKVFVHERRTVRRPC